MISNKYLQIQFNVLPPSRVVAGLFHIPDRGYLFWDVGWNDSSLKPYHEIGEMIDNKPGRWTFLDKGGCETTITEIDENDDLYDQAVEWNEYATENLKGMDLNYETRRETMLPDDVKIITDYMPPRIGKGE